MSRWFRFYDDAINDPKVLRLSDAMFRAWVTLLCLASKNEGTLPPTKDIALVLRMKPVKIAEWLTILTAGKLLDCQEDGSFRPHNWDSRQFKSDTKDETAAERMRRYRALHRNERNGDARVTVPRTDTDTDTEQKDHCPVAKATRTKEKYSEEFEQQFWKPYPRTPIMSKQEAWREWMKLSPDDRQASCQALPSYIRHLAQNPTLQAVHACRFLSQRRAEGILEIAAEKPSFDVRKHLVS